MHEQNHPSEIIDSKKTSFWRELLWFGLIALFVVVPFRMFIAQPFVVNGASMDPTFVNGQYLIVDQLSYRFKDPGRGEVIIFKYPLNPSKYFIKRVIGLPGERLEVQNGTTVIYNNENPGGITLSEPYIQYKKSDTFTITLADSQYFVMGDNRIGSSDSRAWGPLPIENIVGRPLVRLFPIKSIEYLPGIYQTESSGE